MAKKNKIIIGVTAGMVALAVMLSMILTGQKSFVTDNPVSEINSSEPSSELTVNPPGYASKAESSSGDVTEENPGNVLDVDGIPASNNSEITMETSGSTNSSSNNGASANQQPNQPAVNVEVTPDSIESKDTLPNPNPPDVSGYTQISEGFENIMVNTEKSTEKLQFEIGLLVGSNLENAGYTNLYFNAGSVQKMAEDSVKEYAKTGKIELNPSGYALPEISGYYNAKLPVKGANVKEAAEYVSGYIQKDTAFSEKTKYLSAKEGFLSVYQKDGYFYVLFAVINRDNMTYAAIN